MVQTAFYALSALECEARNNRGVIRTSVEELHFSGSGPQDPVETRKFKQIRQMVRMVQLFQTVVG